jgi:hypothetical protein
MNMNGLVKYVIENTIRGECQCGKCIDKGDKPDPIGHTADMIFFKVALQDIPDKEKFVELTKNHKGIFCECNPFDGNEHNYIELGGWIGDQGLAMQYMGLGTLLGVFELRSPITMLGLKSDDPIVMQMVGIGYLTIEAKKEEVI